MSILWQCNLLQWYDSAIHDCWSLWRWTRLYFPHLSMGNEGNKVLTPANNFKKDLAISGFLPVLHLLLSEDCPACPLHWGGRFKVQHLAESESAGPLSEQQLCEDKADHFYCLWIACQQFLGSYKKKKRKQICQCELVLDKNLQSGIKIRCGCGF